MEEAPQRGGQPEGQAQNIYRPPPMSGKKLKESQHIEKKAIPPRDETPTKEVITDVANEGEKVATPNQLNVSFPQRLKDEKKDKKFTRFLEIFRKLHVNIPFIEAITQMSNYAKFLKNIIFNKEKLEEFVVVNLTEECSIVLLKKLPPKLKDLGCFTIPCIMDNSNFDKALFDLDASINLMSFFAFKKLDLTITHPCDIAEDILVKVGKFIFYVNFVILDMEEDDTIPIILGQPFFAIGKTIIDVEKDELNLRLGNEKVKFIVFSFNKISSPLVSCNCMQTFDNSNGEISKNYKRKPYFETLGNSKPYKVSIKK
ncbi:hypothetical protein CR513_62205, partial [Mucuna pruriens]